MKVKIFKEDPMIRAKSLRILKFWARIHPSGVLSLDRFRRGANRSNVNHFLERGLSNL